MTDKEKLEAIKAELHRLKEVRGVYKDIFNDIFAFINSLPEEPVSEELEEVANTLYPYEEMYDVELPYPSTWDANKEKRDAFKTGAQWQKQKIKRLVDKIDVDNHSSEDLEDLYDNLCEMVKNFKGE